MLSISRQSFIFSKHSSRLGIVPSGSSPLQNEKLSRITICTTMFNEENNVRDFLQIINGIREFFHFNFPLIIVNNGSTDATQKMLDDFVPKTANTTLLFNPGTGYGDGVCAALKTAMTDYALLITSDLQYSYADATRMIEKFLQFYDKSDYFCLLSNRETRLDSLYQVLRGRLWKWLLIKIFGLPNNFDPASQLKIVPVGLSLSLTSRDFIWDIEQVLTCIRRNIETEVIPVSFFPRKNGKSSLSGGFFKAELNAARRLLFLLRSNV